jgi:hypothetical protein
LYFPWLHDVGAFSLIGPQTGPGQIFPVSGEIKNVGQYEECCFKTYVEVAEIDYDSESPVYDFDFGPSCYPFPWTGWSAKDTNWRCSYSTYAGGSSRPELRFYYYPISYPYTYRFISPPIDTTGFGAIKVEFQHAQTYYRQYGTYTMEFETSTDGVSWDSIWDAAGPISAEKVTLVTGENVGGSEMRISFSVKTETYSILYWYIDDLVITGFPLKDAEYEDQYCIDKIPVGETFEIEFDDWTPEFLQYETTGTKTYKAAIWTDLFDPEDNNHANDATNLFLELDFFHDVAVQDEMSSPDDKPDDVMYFATDCTGYPSNSRMVWFDPADPGTYYDIGKWPDSIFPQGATFIGDELWFCNTQGTIYKKVDPLSEEYETVGSAGTGELVSLAWHEKTKVLYGMSTKNLYTIDMETGKATSVGSMGNPGLMISCDCDEDGIMYSYELDFTSGDAFTIDLETGRATKLGETGLSCNYGQDMAYDWEGETMMIAAFNYGSFAPELHWMDRVTGDFTFIDRLYGSQTTCLAIPGGGPGIDVYVAPGNQDIIAIAENVGTFPERDMSCTAEINEYITDCENGTLVYEDLIEGIDILTPLGGTETLTFDDYNFAVEGFYAIFVNITDDNDDNLGNNNIIWGIGCDATPPSSTHALDPAAPDGLNDYYISDVEVTLDAVDPEIGCGAAGSGVKEIKYQLNDDPVQTIPGDHGTFVINTDSNLHTVEYWAVDWVDNAESKHSFTLKMDQTAPVITLAYEILGGNPLQGWDMLFQANAVDETSGMERVEFRLEERLQDTVSGPGPLYEWGFTYHGGLKLTVKAEAYDFAGLMSFAEVELRNSKNLVRNKGSNSQTQSSGTNVLLR